MQKVQKKMKRTSTLPTKRRALGFSLIEVLLAIGMVSLALIAGMAVSMTLTRFAERQPELVLAQLCAQNDRVRWRLLRQLPAGGESASSCTQAGRDFSVRLSVTATANPDFRQVRTQVQQVGAASGDAQQVLLSLSTVMGRY
jgi:general secretion pathway protein I